MFDDLWLMVFTEEVIKFLDLEYIGRFGDFVVSVRLRMVLYVFVFKEVILLYLYSIIYLFFGFFGR